MDVIKLINKVWLLNQDLLINNNKLLLAGSNWVDVVTQDSLIRIHWLNE
jgi:hypothetical protein